MYAKGIMFMYPYYALNLLILYLIRYQLIQSNGTTESDSYIYFVTYFIHTLNEHKISTYLQVLILDIKFFSVTCLLFTMNINFKYCNMF